jgi:VPDSG-CTERM motif
MKTLILAAIRCSLMFTAVTASLFSVRPAQAYTVTLEQVGSNVVANGSGAFNLTGLIFDLSGISSDPFIWPSVSIFLTGPSQPVDSYFGLSGPRSFGAGGRSVPSSSSGDAVGGLGFSQGLPRGLLVPHGYVSGNALSSSATWNNATFASLGMTPGTYVWRWGTGLENQNFTLVIGKAGVPDGGSTVSLLGFGLLGLAALRRKLSC